MRKLLATLCSLGLLLAASSLWAPGVAAFEGVVKDSGVRVRSAPSVSAAMLKKLYQGQEVDVVDSASGSNVGGNNLWYQLPSGGWVHSSLISRGGTVGGTPFSGRWVDVDIGSQTTMAMEGDRVIYTASVTTGRPGFDTPRGTFYIKRRVFNETMDSSTIGIPRDGPGGWYLQNVYFTQYFTDYGNALHYNYWAPRSVFGNSATSAGCVGMDYADAKFFWDFASIGTPVRIHD